MYTVAGPLHAKPDGEQVFGHDRYFIITENLTSTEALPDGYHWRPVFIHETPILVVAHRDGMPYAFESWIAAESFIKLAKQGSPY